MIRPRFETAIAERLTPSSMVLDVGGAREPFRFATHVMDVVSRDQAAGLWGQTVPRHAPPPENWIVYDICSPEPFPFPDKFFDFVVCGHTLEDVRDPVRVCRELSRVAKAGYIETPSPLLELTRGMDPAGRHWVGYYHHRWLVDVVDGELVFLFKPHFLHASRRFHFPPRYGERWQHEGRAYTCLLWDGEVRAREHVIVVREALEAEIERVVRGALGTTWPMRWARVRERLFQFGVQVTDRLGLRTPLRPLAAWVVRWR